MCNCIQHYAFDDITLGRYGETTYRRKKGLNKLTSLSSDDVRGPITADRHLVIDTYVSNISSPWQAWTTARLTKGVSSTAEDASMPVTG